MPLFFLHYATRLNSGVMHTDQAPLSSYDRFAKAAILIGVPFFFLMGVASLWWVATEQNGFAAMGIFAGMAVFFLGLATFGLRLIPHIHSAVAASPDGLHIFDKQLVETFHPWTSISHYKDYPILQVLDLYDTTGKRVLSVDYYISNFGHFQAQVSQSASAGA